MGRKKEWPPVPHQHKASGQDRVCLNGQHVYLGKTGSDEARRNYAKLIADLAEQKPPEARPRRTTGLLVGELVDRWDEYATGHYDPAGREAKQFVYSLAPLVRRCAGLPAAKVDSAVLEDVREDMIKLGWARKVINRRIVRIRTVWRWAERRGHVPRGSWEGLRTLEPIARNRRGVTESRPRRACEWPDLAAVCRQCPPLVRDMLLVGWFSGARPKETREMRVGEVDRSKDVWLYRPGTHKNAWRDGMRVVPLGPRAQKVLTKHLAGKAAGDFVFPSAPGRCYTTEGYSRAVARACERAGVKVIPYQGRHAAKQRATRALGLDSARAMLGQAHLTTADLYAAGQDERLAVEAARRLG